LEKFREGVREVQDLVEIMQGLGPRIKREEGVKKGDWRFQAKGVVRTFIGRTRGSWVADEGVFAELLHQLLERIHLLLVFEPARQHVYPRKLFEDEKEMDTLKELMEELKNTDWAGARAIET
jgi:hypothetical protein